MSGRHRREDPVHVGIDRRARRASSTRSGCCCRTRSSCARCCRSSPTSRRCSATGCPWNHTFGGNHNFGLALYNGGTLYIDAGTPIAGARFATTAANLREIATDRVLQRAARLRAARCRRCARTPSSARALLQPLQILFYAAAGLRQRSRTSSSALAVETCGERVPWVTGLGATETRAVRVLHGRDAGAGQRASRRAGARRRAEARAGRRPARSALRGPNITPGYWRDDALTRAAFDEDGFYAMGDAVRLRRSGRSRARASCSRDGSPRTSSCRPAPGCASARCGGAARAPRRAGPGRRDRGARARRRARRSSFRTSRRAARSAGVPARRADRRRARRRAAVRAASPARSRRSARRRPAARPRRCARCS